MGKRSSPGFHIKLPEHSNFYIHMSKKPKIEIPTFLDGESPLSSPTQSEESFEKELNRSRKEFNQFNMDLDEISKTVEKLVAEAPEWFTGIEEMKKKQDSVEECITAAQEKITENQQRLEQLKTLQDEANDDINNDLKKIQEQLFELLENHRSIRANVDHLDDSQSRTTEQLDLMLQAIHEYARLIEEASLTIKHFDDVGTPIQYESLDISPFRTGEFSGSYFEEHIYRASRATTPTTSLSTTRSSSPILFQNSGVTSAPSDPSSPLSPTGPPHPQPIHPLPYYQLRHQQLLLFGMRRAAVGLKFLLYAKHLNDLKDEHSGLDYDPDRELLGDSIDEFFIAHNVTRTKSTALDSSCCSSSNSSSGSDDSSNSSSGSGCNSSDYQNRVSTAILKRSLVFHSYDLFRRPLIKQQG